MVEVRLAVLPRSKAEATTPAAVVTQADPKTVLESVEITPAAVVMVAAPLNEVTFTAPVTEEAFTPTETVEALTDPTRPREFRVVEMVWLDMKV